MLYNNIKLYLITCITVILLVNPAIAAEDKKTSNNDHYTIYLRHPLDFINRPLSALDYYWNSIFDDRLSIYDSSAIKSKFITQDKQYILVLEVPGYDKSHIKLKVNNHKLFIAGNIDDTKANGATDHLNKKFNYIMSLYDDIDQNAISSKLKNGILTIILPRTELKDQNGKEILVQ